MARRGEGRVFASEPQVRCEREASAKGPVYGMLKGLVGSWNWTSPSKSKTRDHCREALAIS